MNPAMMKYTVPTLLMLALSLDAAAQKVSDADVPHAVKAAFAKPFPNAKQVKWEMEGKDYEAEFEKDGIEWSTTYTADGTWLGTEHTIKADALPEAVRKTIAAKYAGHKLKETEEMDTPKGTLYEVALLKDGRELEIVLDLSGAVVSVEEEGGVKEDEEDND
jgi:hypothetical protein